MTVSCPTGETNVCCPSQPAKPSLANSLARRMLIARRTPNRRYRQVNWKRTVAGIAMVIVLAAWHMPAHAQKAGVAGQVIDARTKQPLADVLVHLDHHPTFVETDRDGRFTLELSPGQYALSASLIG